MGLVWLKRWAAYALIAVLFALAAARPVRADDVSKIDTLNQQVTQLQGQGKYARAVPIAQRALALAEKAFGPEDPNTLTSLNNLAALYEAMARFAEAEPLYRRSLNINEKNRGPQHESTLGSLDRLAGLYFVQGDWVHSTEFLRRRTAILAAGTLHYFGDVRSAYEKSDAEKSSSKFRDLLKAAYRVMADGSSREFAAEMFETAQWAISSEAAAAFAQMAARGATGDPELAKLVRRRQDLLMGLRAFNSRMDAEYERMRQNIRAKRSEGELAVAEAVAEANDYAARFERMRAERAEIANNPLREIDSIFKDKFPNYQALVSSAPITVKDVQTQLGPEEALVLFLDTESRYPAPEETFVWVVTKTDLRWVRTEFGTKALAREVQALRCGLDETNWDGEAQNCTGLTKARPTRDADDEVIAATLPFELDRAHSLYKALFGQVEDLIKGKQLLVVPSGPLTKLPFQVLITDRPASNDYRSAAWLIRRHPVTVLPAVSSLKALRTKPWDGKKPIRSFFRTLRITALRAATSPYIGFGNPLLDGGSDKYKKDAEDARRIQKCSDVAQKSSAYKLGPLKLPSLSNGGQLANPAFVRLQVRIPGSAKELCDVAHLFKAENEVRLGERAKESVIKELSEKDGQLAKFRIVHFVTHGFVSGDLNPGSEPGLIFTPPQLEKESEWDDGYLSASEIAALKLDADWVILSACNTAAGGSEGAEALSGLARAFIYAQARALLVTHWAADSDETIKLVTKTMNQLKGNRNLARAEAFRRSMLALVDEGEPKDAHPANWAPFILVGDGGPL